MIHATAFLTTLLSVFLKVFQQKNVIDHRILPMMATSYAIAICEVGSVLLAVRGGFSVVPAIGTGGALGALFAVYTHKKLFGKL